MTDREAPEVVVEKFIKAAPARVYRALTDARELERWFFTHAESDPRPGGGYRLRYESLDKPNDDHDRFGRYLELVPGEKVVFEWKGDGPGSYRLPPDTIVSIMLTPEGGGTRVRFVHSGWPAGKAGQKDRDSHEGGWNFFVGNLASMLEGGPDLRLGRTDFRQRVKGH